MVDRLEQTLRSLQAKHTKKQKGEAVVQTIIEITQEIKSDAFMEAIHAFQENDEPAIIEREIEISNAENEEYKTQPIISVKGIKKKEPLKSAQLKMTEAPPRNVVSSMALPKTKEEKKSSKISPAQKQPLKSDGSVPKMKTSTGAAAQRPKLEESKDEKTGQAFTKQKK
jgi:hypothetical protein